jgi:hypothetical protein
MDYCFFCGVNGQRHEDCPYKKYNTYPIQIELNNTSVVSS